MLKRLSIGRKLTLVVGLPVLATLLFAAIGFPTLNAVKIGSPKYNEVIESKDLVADILPPPEFLVESFLTLHQLVDVTDRARFEALRGQLTSFEQDYNDRHQHWADAFADEPDDEMAKLLVVQSYESAHQFWQVVDTQFVPAVEASLTSGDREPAEELLAGQLNDLYEAHRASIVAIVPKAEARVAGFEKASERTVSVRFAVLGVVLVLLVGAALGLAAIVARSIIEPIRRLRSAANGVVTELSAADAEDRVPVLEPLDLATSAELASTAESFNAVATTTVGLLEKQALLRRNTAEVYVNLGRRNRSLLSRTLGIISRLEKDERNPAALDQLFRLDHLTTRMRRNAENLLVLAGASSARPSERPAHLADVVRGALSEIEDYTRVDVVSLEPATLVANAVADITHLVAELVENATAFSPPTTRVKVEGLVVSDGYLLTVADEGMGMKPETLARANERLATTTDLDTAPLTTLGLHVVGRLATRHRVQVRLVEGPTRGTVAKILIPTAALHQANAEAPAADGDRPGSDRAPSAQSGRTAQSAESARPGQSARTTRSGQSGRTAEDAPAAAQKAAPSRGPASRSSLRAAPPTVGDAAALGNRAASAARDDVETGPVAPTGSTVAGDALGAPARGDDAEAAGDAAADGGREPVDPASPAAADDRAAAEDATAAPGQAVRRRVRGAQLDGMQLRAERRSAAPSTATADRDRDRLSSFQSGVRKAEYDAKRRDDANPDHNGDGLSATTEED